MSDKVRTDEEKAQMYSAMLGGANVITSVLDADNEFYNDMTNAQKKEKVMRSAGYLEFGVALKDWGSEDFTDINSAIAAAKAYSA
jgi:hypothetical protein|tara:strand:- start:5 stop:259 length:255 start_codon:yes stop_codon:yes gene_type:complete